MTTDEKIKLFDQFHSAWCDLRATAVMEENGIGVQGKDVNRFLARCQSIFRTAEPVEQTVN